MSIEYRIRIAAHLDPAWSAWLGNLKIHHSTQMSILQGEFQDPATLYDLILKLRDLDIILIAIESSFEN